MAISNKMSILGTKKAVLAYNGGYYLPSVSEEGILSWTPTVEGMAPIPEVNVRGPQGSDASVTAEAIQAVAPISWDETSIVLGEGATNTIEKSVAIGTSAKSQNWPGVAIGYKAFQNAGGVAVGNGAEGQMGVAIGNSAKTVAYNTTAVGSNSTASGTSSTAVGYYSKVKKNAAISIGAEFSETVDDSTVRCTCSTEGTGSITIGAGANTLNTTDADGGIVESSNSVTIGCKAKNQGADSVVIGAQAETEFAGNVVIGTRARGNAGTGNVSIGTSAKSNNLATAIGYASNASYASLSNGYSSWSNVQGTAVGFAAGAAASATAVGAVAKANGTCSTAIGYKTNTSADNSTAIGHGANSTKANSITLGAQFTETTDDGDVINTCTTEGTGSITIGAGANTLNNGDTESSNSVTIGCKANNTGLDNVLIGANAKTNLSGNVVIGTGASSNTWQSKNNVVIGTLASTTNTNHNVAVGYKAQAYQRGVAIGSDASASANGSMAIGSSAVASGQLSIAIGGRVSDHGTVVFRSTNTDGGYTQLYFSGANSPLANTYENGEAMMGYVVCDRSGNVMTDAEGNAMVGTQKLSVLFPNNRGENAFTPAALNLDEGWTPKPMFRPSDLDLPVEDPEQVEEYQPLPVYPIVEPGITGGESEQVKEYQPLPVYPIVEPELEEI